MTTSNGSRGLAALRQSLAELQRVIRRPAPTNIPQIPTPRQAAETAVQIAEVPLQGLEALGRVEAQLGQIEGLLRSPSVQPFVSQIGGLEKVDQLLTGVDLLLQKSTVLGLAPEGSPAGLPSFDALRQLPLDETAWRRVLLESLPAQTRALELIQRHLAAIETFLRAGAAPATILQLGTLPDAAPVVTSEALVKAVLITPTVAVSAERELFIEFTDLVGNPIKFEHLSITEVDIAALQLVNADDVRLRLFRTGQRRVPQDLVAEFTGTSAVANTWQASFSNRRIEYTDVAGESKLYIAIRNTAGNSGPTTFDLRFYARTFPKLSR